MQIVNDKVLVVSTRQPHLITEAIEKSKVVNREADDYDVAVHWGLQEAQALTALKFPSVPSPIQRDYKWTGKLTPFSHQRETAAFLTLNQKAFCFSEAGTGKTAAVIWAADYLMKVGKVKRVLVICPVSIMKAAWQQDLFKFAMHRSCSVAHGDAKTRTKIVKAGAEFVIINYDGLAIVKDEVMAGGFDMIVVDECFVAGTPVLTPSGVRPIETLQVGDEVYTSSGVSLIKRTSKREATDLVELRLSTGEILTCTEDHPFFTSVGWVRAGDAAGTQLLGVADVQTVRDGVPDAKSQVGVAPSEGHRRRQLLLKILCSEELARKQSGEVGVRRGTPLAVDTEPETRVHPDGREPKANIRHDAGAGAEASGQRRQRHGYDTARSAGGSTAGGYVGVELPGSIGAEAARLSYLLQAGLRGPDTEARVGGGRRDAPLQGGEGARREEDSVFSGARVESVTHHQRGSSATVYNLEVGGTPNYFVGAGHLVHNCTAYKNPMTTRWKVLKEVASKVPWLWMLTGTPAAQSPLDAYGLAKLVNPAGVSPYYGQFRDKVMYKLTQFSWAPRPESKDIVHAALQPAIRFEKRDCLDLPPVTHVEREAPLTPQQTRYYNTLKNQLRMEAAGEDISAVNAAAKLTKLLQISGGAVYSDTGEVVEFDVSNRINVVLEVVEETTNKVLIFVPFTHTIELLKRALEKNGITCAVLSGSVSMNARSDAVHDFQNKPDPRVLLIQPQAAAHGLTLTAADTIIWYAPVTSVETYLQANARNDRPGQKNPMTVVHIKGSEVETKLYAMLRSKVSNHTKLVDLYRSEIDS